jgi:hypothetical protein
MVLSPKCAKVRIGKASKGLADELLKKSRDIGVASVGATLERIGELCPHFASRWILPGRGKLTRAFAVLLRGFTERSRQLLRCCDIQVDCSHGLNSKTAQKCASVRAFQGPHR